MTERNEDWSGLDWVRLGAEIQSARESKRWTQQGLADAAKVSLSTVQNLEGGRTYKQRPLQLQKVESALGWAEGSAEDILRGGEPMAPANTEDVYLFIVQKGMAASPRALKLMKVILEADIAGELPNPTA